MIMITIIKNHDVKNQNHHMIMITDHQHEPQHKSNSIRLYFEIPSMTDKTH